MPPADAAPLVLVTRPLPDGQATAEVLRARGYRILLDPMLEIVLKPEPLDLAGVQALLVTSANGARALAAATDTRSLPLFAVGEASADTAGQAGFSDIHAGSGDVGGLAELVRAKLDPAAGALLHAAGSHIAGDLAGDLERGGYGVRRAVLYEARAATRLSEATRTGLAAGTIAAALFYSPRSAKRFVTLADESGFGETMARLIAICLSDAVADALSPPGALPGAPIRLAGIHVAAQPEQAALLEILDAVLTDV
ncbi:MAG: uroporphyrinogen-III synthase [Alphaproteobacteria bacterium]|nr:uroporphyrinogen-III synthase [Alphaproteobacteria bacterium]